MDNERVVVFVSEEVSLRVKAAAMKRVTGVYEYSATNVVHRAFGRAFTPVLVRQVRDSIRDQVEEDLT